MVLTVMWCDMKTMVRSGMCKEPREFFEAKLRCSVALAREEKKTQELWVVQVRGECSDSSSYFWHCSCKKYGVCWNMVNCRGRLIE